MLAGGALVDGVLATSGAKAVVRRVEICCGDQVAVMLSTNSLDWMCQGELCTVGIKEHTGFQR